MDKLVLEELCSKGLSTYKIASILECSQTKVMYWLTKYSLRTSPDRKDNTVCENCGRSYKMKLSNPTRCCSHKCASEYRYKENIKDWISGDFSKFGDSRFPEFARKFLLERANYSCEGCGWDKINLVTGRSPLQIHHADGDSQNNSIENLVVLCPNCHSLTPTYGSLNRGYGRKYRREYRNKDS